MKKILLLSIVVSSFSAAQLNTKSGSELCSEKHRDESAALLKSSSPSTIPHTFDVLHYFIDIDLHKNYNYPFPKTFSGNVTITLRIDSAVASIQLNADNSSIGIDSIPYAKNNYSHSNNILSINLERIYFPGESLSVQIFYHHKNVDDAAFYVGTDGMVFTDNEPERARNWFPCWDKPSDKATVEVKAVVPKNVKLGSNGKLLLDSLINDSTRVFHWKSRDPIATYLTVISSKVNYNLDIVYWKKPSNPNDSIPIYFYWNTGEDVTALQNIKTKIGPMTTYYSSLFGEHPFEKNGFATMNGLFTWGGMENQTLTSIMSNGYKDESLIAHEYAHQWLGDMITCDTWADIWLNEGFATYCEALWLGKTNGYDHYKQDIENDANYYLNANPGWPIYNPSWASSTPSLSVLFNYATTYCKGACVLHMLRHVLGDSVFFHSLYEYTSSSKFKFGTASTDDLIEQFSTSAGKDLSWFFDQWIKKANHPNYVVQYSLNPEDSTADVLISQSNADQGYWEMPIELSFMMENRPDTTLTVVNSINNQQFHFKFPSVPTSFGFDSKNDIVLKSLFLKKVTSVGLKNALPLHFSVEQNYPNPFNPATTITYSIENEEVVTIDIFNILGEKLSQIVNQKLPAGVHTTQFDGSSLPSGIYFYTVRAGTESTTKRMILLK